MSKKQYVNKDFVKAVCDILKEIRERDDRTQDDVSVDIFNDIKYNFHIGRLETSGGNMRLSTLFELCKTYGVPMSEFFEKLEEKYSSLKITPK